MAADIPVYESVPTERVGSDNIRVGDSLYSFDSAHGGYLWSGTAPPIVEETVDPYSYDPMFGVGVFGDEGSDIPIEVSPRTPPVGMLDPMAPWIIEEPSYPSGFGLMSPLDFEPSRIDWSTVPDISRGGGGSVGDVAVGAGGELLYGDPEGYWSGIGSLYDTPLWTPHEEYAYAGFGALTPPDTLPPYTPMAGPRDLTGGGWSYVEPMPEPDYTAYVESYPDLGSAYTTYKDAGGPAYPTAGDFGEWHWDAHGEGEGREMVTIDPFIPDDWYPFADVPPPFPEPFEAPPITIPDVTDTPSFGVLESIATGTPIEPAPTETLPPVAPPVEPPVETMPPMLPTESVVDPYGPSSLPPVVDPDVELGPLMGGPIDPSAPLSPLATSSGISGSPITAAMEALSPSFAGGGGLLCDPITGKCPQYR